VRARRHCIPWHGLVAGLSILHTLMLRARLGTVRCNIQRRLVVCLKSPVRIGHRRFASLWRAVLQLHPAGMSKETSKTVAACRAARRRVFLSTATAEQHAGVHLLEPRIVPNVKDGTTGQPALYAHAISRNKRLPCGSRHHCRPPGPSGGSPTEEL